jgi:D-3-phosphoglycerate dehydrogenase
MSEFPNPNGPLVLLPQDIAAPGKDFLLRHGYRIRLCHSIDEDTLCREVIGCQAILARTALITRRVLEAEPNLQVIGRHGVGYDNVDIRAATDLGIWVTNAPHSNANTVAEHTIGLLIALAHNLLQHDQALRSSDFEIRNRALGTDLTGKTLGIVGLGNIGSLVARKAALGLDMKVIALNRTPRPLDEWIEPVQDGQQFFERSDFVSLHLPGSPQTRHYVGERELAWMKPSAFLINVSRGEIIDEPALTTALQKGRIAGAGLDVFDPEPPQPDNPLFALKNVIVTPHSAALTTEAMERMGLHAAQGIHDVLSGKTPQWPVNKPNFHEK